MKRSRILTGICLGLCFALLTGCAGISTDDLYCLPEASADYYNLQEAVSSVLDEGFSFLAPTAGAHQEAVQLEDLDGDGTAEAVTLLKNESDNTIRLAVFATDGSAYSLSAEADCDGISVSTVEYANLFGDGGQEIILRCQVSEKVTQALQIYSYSAGTLSQLAAVSSDGYVLTDFDGDGTEDLVSISGIGSDTASIRWLRTEDGSLNAENTADCMGGTSLTALSDGKLSDGTPAVFMTTEDSDAQTRTEIFTASGDALCQVLPADFAGGGGQVPEDIDGDGFTEIPAERTLPAYDEGSTAQSVTEWYRVDKAGTAELAETVYHNTAGDWSFRMPPAWQDQVSIRVSSETGTAGQTGLTLFSRVGSREEIMTVYTLQGSDRQEYAEANGLTILYTDSNLIVAVALADTEPWDGSVTLAQISELFIAPETENTDTDAESD